MNKINVVILSSAQLNDSEVLKEHSSEIINFLTSHLPSESFITIGVIKNVNLINFLEENGYEISRKNQRLGSLENSNKKLIRENDLVLFFRFLNNPNIDDFIEYAKQIDGKNIKILNLTQIASNIC